MDYEIHTIKIHDIAIFQGKNPTIFVEAGAHSHEWIGPATATLLLNQLLFCKHPEIRMLAQNYDWVIIPVLNVDGYVYTHRSVGVRMD